MPLLLRLYLAFAAISGPFWRRVLKRRRAQGKEHPSRAEEKLGRYTLPRPDGPLTWFHAVSVGEAMALVTLINRLLAAHPALQILITTHSVASEQALAARKLPARVIHQFAPADHPGTLTRFMAHWRPDALVVAEADLWPVMLLAARRAGLPMLLMNTHVTPRRYRRRRRMARTNGYLMNLFDRILVQDADSLEMFKDLGAPAAKMEVMGVLKAASAPLPDLPDERARLTEAIADRPVWLAASTWAVEEPQILDAAKAAADQVPGLLCLIAPRQPKACDQTEAAARARFTHVARRSHGEAITPETQVYIADTIGEMGLWYRLSPIAFVGNSLPSGPQPMTGHNPFEPAALGAMVLHGPEVNTFAEAYAWLKAEGGALEVADGPALARAIVAAQDPAFRKPFIEGAARVLAANLHPLERAQAAMEAVIAQLPRR